MFENAVKKYVNSKNIIFLIVLLLFLTFIFTCKDIAIMFFASFVIACSLNPIVDKMTKKMPRNIAAIIVTSISLLIIIAVFIPVCIITIEQIKIFLYKLPKYIDSFDEYIFTLPVLNQFTFLAPDTDNLMEQISISSTDILANAINIGKSISSFFMYFLVSIILIFNFIVDKTILKNFFLKSFPSNMRKRAEKVGKIISEKMGGYIIATLTTSLSVGIVMLIGLLILKVPYAHLLSVISAVFDIIPVIGPTIALIVCLLATYDAGSGAVIAVVAIFTLAQLIENNLVRPYIFGKVMHIHPVAIFLFLFLATKYIGVIGTIFAPALAALCSVLYEELYLKKLG